MDTVASLGPASEIPTHGSETANACCACRFFDCAPGLLLLPTEARFGGVPIFDPYARLKKAGAYCVCLFFGSATGFLLTRSGRKVPAGSLLGLVRSAGFVWARSIRGQSVVWPNSRYRKVTHWALLQMRLGEKVFPDVPVVIFCFTAQRTAL